jgi:peroxiredoxin Q/BCP
MSLSVGDQAPDFKLPGTSGAEVSLSGFQGAQNVVLVFYTADSTSG